MRLCSILLLYPTTGPKEHILRETERVFALYARSELERTDVGFRSRCYKTLVSQKCIRKPMLDIISILDYLILNHIKHVAGMKDKLLETQNTTLKDAIHSINIMFSSIIHYHEHTAICKEV